jgi:hypothetical protein
MTDAEFGEWATDVLECIRRHQRRNVAGLRSMMNAGLIDFLDALAIAPLLANEIERIDERAEFESRRLQHLDELEIDKRDAE